MRRLAGAACLAAIFLASGGASAQPAEKPFSHTINPRGFAEECAELRLGATIDYEFESSDRVDFNIHYHLGNDVVYTVKGDQVRRVADRFTAPSAEEYCLMWTNRSADVVTVKGKFSR